MKKVALRPALFAAPAVLSLALGLPAHAASAANTMPAQTMPAQSMKEQTLSSAYRTYSPAAFDAAKGTRRVLFFHATWCPNCKRADADIRANLAKLPAGVTVFKTDYDREKALKKQYGITAQHTFVLVDASGKALKKWAGGGLREIVGAVQGVRP